MEYAADSDRKREAEISALWIRFTVSGNRDEYFRNWLGLQCMLIASAQRGVIVVEEGESGGYAPVAFWPEGSRDIERLAGLCEQMVQERCGLLIELPPSENDPGHMRVGIGYPVLVDGILRGAAALEVAVSSEAVLKKAMEQLQWGVCWLELWYRRARAGENERVLARLKSAVELQAGVLVEERFEGAAMAFVTELASRLKCDRVSLGFVRRGRVALRTISHTALFGGRMNLSRSIELAMEEAVAQREEIRFPAIPGAPLQVTRDHEQLSNRQGGEAILSLPLYVHDRCYGVLTLERQAEQQFLDEDAEFCRGVSGLAGPILESKLRQDRAWPLKTVDFAGKQIGQLFGKGRPGRKLLSILLIAGVIFLSIATAEYRLNAEATLEGTIRRVVAAPFDGYIREAPVRAGDLVRRGMIMCALDERDLRLEQQQWRAQQVQMGKQLQEALASHDRVQFNVLTAQLDQVQAHLDLVATNLSRIRIPAPFDGIVVSGDLSQRFGGSVERGEQLFEVAPLDSWRIILRVDERKIADVRVGQHGRLMLSALPGRSFGFTVKKITPVSEAREGHTSFRVEAGLDQAAEHLRPGMEGVGKISVDRRKLVAVWTHDLTDWMRLWIWSWR